MNQRVPRKKGYNHWVQAIFFREESPKTKLRKNLGFEKVVMDLKSPRRNTERHLKSNVVA